MRCAPCTGPGLVRCPLLALPRAPCPAARQPDRRLDLSNTDQGAISAGRIWNHIVGWQVQGELEGAARKPGHARFDAFFELALGRIAERPGNPSERSTLARKPRRHEYPDSRQLAAAKSPHKRSNAPHREAARSTLPNRRSGFQPAVECAPPCGRGEHPPNRRSRMPGDAFAAARDRKCARHQALPGARFRERSIPLRWRQRGKRACPSRNEGLEEGAQYQRDRASCGGGDWGASVALGHVLLPHPLDGISLDVPGTGSPPMWLVS